MKISIHLHIYELRRQKQFNNHFTKTSLSVIIYYLYHYLQPEHLTCFNYYSFFFKKKLPAAIAIIFPRAA